MAHGLSQLLLRVGRAFCNGGVRRLLGVIIFTGVLGLFGFAFIDNAGHLGGLVGGLLLGWFLVRNERWIKEKEKLFKFAGVAALLVLGFTTGFIVYRLMR